MSFGKIPKLKGSIRLCLQNQADLAHYGFLDGVADRTDDVAWIANFFVFSDYFTNNLSPGELVFGVYVDLRATVIEHVRLKYGCRGCETGVKTAPVPVSPIPKCIATPGLLAWITISKYGDALPLYRQVSILKRIDVEISRATLANWMVRTAQLLKPLYEALKEQLLKQPAIMADETTVQVLKEEGREATAPSYMWLYRNASHSQPVTIYEY